MATDYHNAYSLADFVEYATAMVAGDDDNVGCQLSGFIVINRMLGAFHIKPRSNVPGIGRRLQTVGRMMPARLSPLSLRANPLGYPLCLPAFSPSLVCMLPEQWQFGEVDTFRMIDFLWLCHGATTGLFSVIFRNRA